MSKILECSYLYSQTAAVKHSELPKMWITRISLSLQGYNRVRIMVNVGQCLLTVWLLRSNSHSPWRTAQCVNIQQGHSWQVLLLRVITDTCSWIKLGLWLAVHSRVTEGCCLVEYIGVQTSTSVCLHFCTQNTVCEHFIYLYDITAGSHKDFSRLP